MKDKYPENNKNYDSLNIDTVYQFFYKNIDKVEYSKELKNIKKYFYEKNKNIFKDGFNVAIHIRRQNKHDGGAWKSWMHTDDKYVINLIENIRKKYKEKNPTFHIYSQGDINRFNNFLDKDILLHLNTDIKETFLSFVSADILCTSASTFSYTAALLSNGKIYYHDFCCPPFSSWNKVKNLY